MIYDNGWFRICGVPRKMVHYFHNDKPIHVLKHGVMNDLIDCSERYSFEGGRKCKTCMNILTAYSKIGIAKRCGT